VYGVGTERKLSFNLEHSKACKVENVDGNARNKNTYILFENQAVPKALDADKINSKLVRSHLRSLIILVDLNSRRSDIGIMTHWGELEDNELGDLLAKWV
jgi:hypothetical protein